MVDPVPGFLREYRRDGQLLHLFVTGSCKLNVPFCEGYLALRAYTAATAAFTLRMPHKWVDNVLSHHSIHGVGKNRQGVSRRLSLEAIIELAIALRISRAFGAPVSRALSVARSLGPSGICRLEGVTVSVNLQEIRAEVVERLQQAVETVPVPKRGRPRG